MAFDIGVLGAGSGGGTAAMQAVLRFPFATVGLFDSGEYYATPEECRGEFLQNDVDDKVKRAHPFWVPPLPTNYGASGSPYAGSGYAFATPASEQGLGNIVGGSGQHNGMVASSARPEDCDEWDYLIRNGNQKWKVAGSITWPAIAAGTASVVLVCDAAAAASVVAFSEAVGPAAAMIPARDTFISFSDDPTAAPPFRVVSIDTAAFVPTITITANLKVYGVLVPGSGAASIAVGPGPVGTNVFNTMWNRTRALEVRCEVENDIDVASGSSPIGVDPNIHGTTGYMEISRLGRRRSNPALVGGDITRPWVDFRPSADNPLNVVKIPRQSPSMLAVFDALAFSAVDVGTYGAIDSGGATPAQFMYAPDVDNAESIFASGLSTINPAGALVDATPPGLPNSWGRMYQFGMNYVGFQAGGEPVGYGHNRAGMGRFDKYNERRGPLTVSIQPLIGYRIVTATISEAVAPGEFAVGQTVTTPSAAGEILAAEARTVVLYTSNLAYAAVTAGTTVTTATATGVTTKDAEVFFDTVSFIPYAKLTITIAAGSPLFLAGATLTAPIGASTIGIGARAPVTTQRLQIDMTSGEYDTGELITSTGTATGSITSAPAYSLTVVSGAQIDKLLTDPSEFVDVIAVTTIAGPVGVAVGDSIDGVISGATGIVTEIDVVQPVDASALVADDIVYLRIQLDIGSVPYMQGEPIATGVWNGTAFKTTQVQRIVGVRYIDTTTRVASEVTLGGTILSAGAFASPAILQRTGIGAKSRLAPAGVEQLLDLPGVGDRCITHSFSFFSLVATFPQNIITVTDAPVVGGVIPILDVSGVLPVAYPLTGVNVARTPGANNFRQNLATPQAIAAEIAAAINDPANSYGAIGVVAFVIGSIVYIKANPISGAPPTLVSTVSGTGLLQGCSMDSLIYYISSGVSFRSSVDRSAVPGNPWSVGANNPTGAILFDSDYDCGIGAVGLGQGLSNSNPAGFLFGLGQFQKRLWAGPAVSAATPLDLHLANNTAIGLDVLCMKPRSRGPGVFITSTDPFELPYTDHGLLSNWQSKDAEALLEAMDQSYAKMNDATMAASAIIAFPLTTPPAGAGVTAARINSVISGAGAAYHAVGTLGMGPIDDSLAVCDERGRVRHTLGLRVADNSPYPTHVRINPHYPTVVLAHTIVAMAAEDGGI